MKPDLKCDNDGCEVDSAGKCIFCGHYPALEVEVGEGMVVDKNICLVYECGNKKSEGRFVGDLCAPCHKYLSTGKVGHTKSFLKELIKRDDCKHEGEYKTEYDHIRCDECGAVKTDSGWGLASDSWFKNIEEAEYYKKHGRYPEKIRKVG